MGALEYRAGRGLRIGETGLNLGGYVTAEVAREEGGPGTFEIDGINFLLLFEPVHFVRVFSEIELGNLLFVDDDRGDVMSDPALEIGRLYGELSVNDYLNVRFGKFLTPIGRWNPVPAEPFVWTTSEPLIAELTFDEHMTGAMLRGSLFPPAATLTYSLYGQFLDPLDADMDPVPADRSVGLHLDYTTALGEWSTGASFLSSERDGAWHHFGGLDAQWRPGALELTGELLFADGDFEERDLWGAYLQGAYEVLPTVYLVGRYEHFDPAGVDPTVNLFDLGVAWIPRPYLLLKADYLFADRGSEAAAPGFRASLSVLF